jgi:tRNA(fMet)-specific endonuclease VapC
MDLALLDTDILSEVLKQRDPTVVQRAADYLHQFGTLAFSVVSRYEITRGLKHKHASSLLPRFELVCQHSLVLPASESVFDRAAGLWVLARQGGYPVGDADLLIAGTALESGRTLITGNTAHFSWIPNLSIGNWRA